MSQNQSLHFSYNQLGYTPGSAKVLTFCPPPEVASLPLRIPVYLRGVFDRIPRDRSDPSAWRGEFFRWPFDLMQGRLCPDRGRIAWSGELVAQDTRWGRVWQTDFSEFNTPGIFQLETDMVASAPFTISEHLYDRLQRGFLTYLGAQRSGCDIPGLRKAEHLDDGVLDTDGTQVNAAGGWYDAGDLRKWMFLTQPNLSALSLLARHGHPGLRQAAVDEIHWGNRFFHAMVAPSGQVWEDLAGGVFKAGLDYTRHWWYENHPGCNADGQECRYTDNIRASGDERRIRTTYNAAVQFMFVRTQLQASLVLPEAEALRCRELAVRAWAYGRNHREDRRTLFVAEELLAALELYASKLTDVGVDTIQVLAEELLGRVDTGSGGLEGYFLENDGADGFRCIALSCEPLIALLRLCEINPKGLAETCASARAAIERHVECYLLRDALSNPFEIPPYGVYVAPPMREQQLFRDAGRGRGVRTFIHPFSEQQIVHGTGGVIMHQAAALAFAGRLFTKPHWMRASEMLIHWTLGHNPEALCLHQGVGYRHPVPFSAYLAQVPEAMCVGHIGRPDDVPYLEQSNLMEWSSQEIWDIPHGHLVEAVIHLSQLRK